MSFFAIKKIVKIYDLYATVGELLKFPNRFSIHFSLFNNPYYLLIYFLGLLIYLLQLLYNPNQLLVYFGGLLKYHARLLYNQNHLLIYLLQLLYNQNQLLIYRPRLLYNPYHLLIYFLRVRIKSVAASRFLENS